VLLLIVLSTAHALAQSSAGSPRTSQSSAVNTDSLSTMKARVAGKEERTNQVAEDFQRLRDLHDDIMRAASAKETVDYKRLAQTAGEVKSRSSRLMTNLALPRASKDKSEKTHDYTVKDDVKEEISLLGEMIAWFVSNRIFQKDVAYDQTDAIKARRDLEDIVELSGRIKKSADKLSKTGGGIK
jgi:hypothetical protein